MPDGTRLVEIEKKCLFTKLTIVIKIFYQFLSNNGFRNYLCDKVKNIISFYSHFRYKFDRSSAIYKASYNVT